MGRNRTNGEDKRPGGRTEPSSASDRPASFERGNGRDDARGVEPALIEKLRPRSAPAEPGRDGGVPVHEIHAGTLQKASHIFPETSDGRAFLEKQD